MEMKLQAWKVWDKKGVNVLLQVIGLDSWTGQLRRSSLQRWTSEAGWS